MTRSLLGDSFCRKTFFGSPFTKAAPGRSEHPFRSTDFNVDSLLGPFGIFIELRFPSSHLEQKWCQRFFAAASFILLLNHLPGIPEQDGRPRSFEICSRHSFHDNSFTTASIRSLSYYLQSLILFYEKSLLYDPESVRGNSVNPPSSSTINAYRIVAISSSFHTLHTISIFINR